MPTINGTNGNDTLLGGAGNDLLNGGAGADKMSGGGGDDTYVVDARGDSIGELASGGGTDTVRSSTLDLALNDYANVENLRLTGSADLNGWGNGLANVVTGNNGANTLDGRGGDDTIAGGLGDDVLIGRAGDDSLDGGAGDDALLGGAGSDVLVYDAADGIVNGGAASDTLEVKGAGATVDLSTGRIRNIEAVDLGGSGDNTLLLSSDAMKAQNESGTLRVNGNGGDEVIANGQWTFEGQDETDSYNIYTRDGAVLEVHEDLTFTDDKVAATVTGDSTGAAEEDGVATVTGHLDATDVDEGEGAFVSAGEATTYGSYAVGTDGEWEYVLDNGSTPVQALTEGETVTDSFVVQTDDGTQQTVTITITGVNDAAAISGDSTGAVTEDGGAALSASGDLDVTDVDGGEAQFLTVAEAQAGYGAYSMGADGTWSYALDNASTTVQALGEGETLIDTFMASSADGTDMQAVTITITGANEAAIITGDTAGDLEEDAIIGITRHLDVADVDGADEFVSAAATTAYGDYTVAADGEWTYDLDNSGTAVQALSEGETVTDSFVVVAADGTQQTVTVTITGNNDAATISGDSTGAVTEDGGAAATATGHLDVSDVDGGEAVFVAGAGAATYGSFTVGAGGEWVYELDNVSSGVQALPEGATVTDSFVVSSLDGTDTQVVTITITGANEPAIITGNSTGSVEEDGVTAVSGGLEVTDVDGAAVFVADGGGTSYGQYTVDTDGEWTYDLDNAGSAVQALPEGETVTDTFVVETGDGTQQSVTITITGDNDPATISGESTGSVTEDGGTAATATGDLDVTDVDEGEAVFLGAAGATTYGSYTLGTDGEWRYHLDNGNAAVQALGAGATLVDTFVAESAEGVQQTITITITGVNDAPESATNFATMPDTGLYDFSPSDFSFFDLDAPDDALLAVKIASAPDSADGFLVLNGNDTIEAGDTIAAGDLDNLQFVQALGASDGAASFTFQVQDDGGTANGGVDMDATPATFTFDLPNDFLGTPAGDAYTGNSAGNVIDGADGNDTLAGGGGDDTIVGGLGDDSLAGGDGNDSMEGGDGNDTHQGGVGDDTMRGGDGDDVYFVGSAPGHDKVFEESAGGVDTIYTERSINLADDNYIERLVWAAAGGGSCIGNIHDNLLVGVGQGVLMDGEGGTDTISYESEVGAVTMSLAGHTAVAGGTDTIQGFENAVGGLGNDSIVGDAIDNVLDGNAGADTMKGGYGDDTYFVDNAGDVVVEDDNLVAGLVLPGVGSSRVDLQACKLEYSIVSPK